MASRFLRSSWNVGRLLLKTSPPSSWMPSRCLHRPPPLRCKTLELNEKDVVVKMKVFHTATEKDKTAFLNIVNSFQDTAKVKRSHVEFIYAAMKCMEQFDANADVDCYKKLMDVFPKGKMIPKNLVQAEFFYFPRHQDCALDLLDMMERNGVCPDNEMAELVINIFGKSSLVFKKLCRQRYWMGKFINLNPYDLPEPITNNVQVLAEFALKKMSIDPRTKITHFNAEELEDSLDKTWIVSAQSPTQQKLLLRHNKEQSLYVEGPFLEWMSKISLFYFVLRADPVNRPQVEVNKDDVSDLSLYMFGEPKPKELSPIPTSEHEQEDATIFGMCLTGTSSKDSVLSWIRFLQKSNPVLDDIPVLFTLKSPPTALSTANGSKTEFDEEEPVDQKTDTSV